MSAWVDSTSYSRDDRERVPQTWTIKFADDFHVTITRHVHYPADAWLLYCPALGISHTETPYTDLEQSKAWALRGVRDRLARWLKAVEAAK